MPTLTITLADSAIANGSVNWTVSDDDVQRMVDHWLLMYASAGDSPPMDADGSVVAWMQSTIATTKDEIERAPESAGSARCSF